MTPLILAALGGSFLGVFIGLTLRSRDYARGHRTGIITGYRKGYEKGVQNGRDEQWVDNIIAQGQRERARRDRFGRWKAKAKEGAQ